LDGRSEVPGKFRNVPLKKDELVKNEEVLHRVKEERNIVHTVK
jgi:hypothetical protein